MLDRVEARRRIERTAHGEHLVAAEPVSTTARDHVVGRLRMSEKCRSASILRRRWTEPVQPEVLRTRSQVNWETVPGPPVGDCWV